MCLPGSACCYVPPHCYHVPLVMFYSFTAWQQPSVRGLIFLNQAMCPLLYVPLLFLPCPEIPAMHTLVLHRHCLYLSPPAPFLRFLLPMHAHMCCSNRCLYLLVSNPCLLYSCMYTCDRHCTLFVCAQCMACAAWPGRDTHAAFHWAPGRPWPSTLPSPTPVTSSGLHVQCNAQL